MKTAVIYARNNTISKEKGSVENQVQICREYAQEKGYTLLRIYADEANPSKPALLQMLEDSKTHSFDAVLVTSPDRLGRPILNYVICKQELKNNGTEVIVANSSEMEVPPNETTMIEAMVESIADYYREQFNKEAK